ncbi:unnamed protein product, partial [Candidula unifasciata]
MLLSDTRISQQTTTFSALSKSSSDFSLRTNTSVIHHWKEYGIRCRHSNKKKRNNVASKGTTQSSAGNVHTNIKDTSSLSSVIAYVFLIVLLINVPSTSLGEPIKVSIHALIPRHFAMATDLTREFSSTVLNFKRDFRNSRLKSFFSTQENISFIVDDTPREILDAFCTGVLAKRAITILNINNPLGIRRRTSSNTYILELSNYLGIPVISWDTQFSGSAQTASANRMLQLAPTIEHQAMAMMSLLERYNWTSFSIVTSQVAGDAQFVAAFETLVEEKNNEIKVQSPGEVKRESFKIVSTFHVRDSDDVGSVLGKALGSDTRVFLLHCSSRASFSIIEAAVKLGLSGKEYIWILTRSSIPTGKYGPESFPVGLM